MIALGIDPGTRRIGYGVVDSKNGGVTFISAGIFKIDATEDIAALEETKREIDRLIAEYRPDVVAIEKLFFAKNQKTAIAVAQSRGVILLATKECGIRIREYTPNEVKLGVAGYGFADKKAVLKMVRLILNKNDLKVIDDASDALALAIFCAGEKVYPQG
ncbi:MAG: crossover junction endodeoxyribonuclease RuvC [Candidatus Pacebacteria bacterium]|nr:crossover junction endodeoxyribonuclease RuvC [Candidatus Paceibacterota bacterium]